MRHLLLLAMVVLLAEPALAERFKALPTDKDNLEMGQQLMNGENFLLAPFMEHPEQYHWTSYYHAAQELFNKGRKDEAVQWYYAGQIRARVGAGLDPDPSRNNTMLTAFGTAIGQPIMAYAHGNKDNWLKQIDNAIAWDKAHPLPNDPKIVIGISDVEWDPANFQAVYDQVRAGLQAMREHLTTE